LNKNYHPDGFVPMQNASVTAPVEGFSFMPKGDGVSLNNMAHPINPDSLETIEIELPDDCKIKEKMVEMSQDEYDTLMRFKENHMRLFKNWVDGIKAPLTHAEAEELIAAHNGLTFSAIRAVERAHGIV